MWKDGKAKFNDEIATKHESNRQLDDLQQGMFT